MKKRNILVELTPLLDVILIMLFVLLVRSQGAVEASADDARRAEKNAKKLEIQLTETEAQYEARLSEAEDKLGEALRRERTLDVVDERSLLLTLSVKDGGVRRILIETESGDGRFVSLDEERLDEAAARLGEAIAELSETSGREAVFLVFQYDRNSIYRTEYDLISGVIQELKPELGKKGIYLSIAEIDIQEDNENG